MRLLRVCIPILVALLIAAWGCTGGGTVASPTPASEEKGAEALDEEVPEGLVFRLTEGRPDQVQKRPPQAQASPLSEAQTRALLQRLPPLKEAQRRPFALREKSLPPPRPGKTVQQPFPPPQSPSPAPAVESGPLQVLRYSPQGEVPLAPFLSLTFSQPMVAVTSHAEAVQTRPVQLSPEPPGNWRWVGARTLLFQPQGRFPMATRYTVTVPAGTTSATGGKLAQATTFTFTTPPPNLESYFPSGGPTELNPLMFVAFDQKIQPEAVLKTIKVQAGNLQPGLRLASDQEVQADPGVRAASSRYSKDRWLAFRATQPLPPDTTVRVTVGPGTPSAEGPLTTTRPQEFSFRTYGPMKLVEARCGYDSECPPLMPWYLRFSNPIDTKRFDRSMVRVVPEVPALKVSVSGDTLYLSGNTRGRTHYTVTIEGTLPDRFGQTLGQTQTVDFRTTSAPPALHSIGGDFVVLDPDGRRTYSVFSINHRDLKVQLYAVTPGDWQAFRRFRESLTSEKPAPPPGKKVLDTSVRTQGQPDELTETAIDLSPALSQGLGQVVVVVQPAVQPKERWQRRYIVAWVQSTRIGLTAMVNHQSLVGWATSLKDGAPLEGVELEILPSGQKGTTGKDGLATLPLPEADSPASMLVGRLGPDLAFLPENTDWYGSGSWYRRPQADSLRWFVFDDRAMYRPSEEVHIKGWIRRIGAGPRGDVGALEGAVEKISYVLTDSRGNQVLKGETRLGTLGGFSLAFTLPKTINLGPTRLELTASGGKGGVEGTSTTHILQVQEFRRPEFEVSASVASEGPTFVGGQATVGVTASYYAGGGLPGAEVTWSVTATPGSYTPPGRDDFVFGTWTPWFFWEPYEVHGAPPTPPGPPQSQTFTGRTDASGRHYLALSFESVSPPRPTSVTAQATVMDVNRQAWSSSANLLVHPADLYVGLKSQRTFVEKGQPIKMAVLVTDLDGKAVPGQPVTLRLWRQDWTWEDGEFRQVQADRYERTLQSGADAVTVELPTREGGTYQVQATVRDARGRPNQTRMMVWVAGGKPLPRRGVEQEKATLIPDRQTYRPGDTAEILVQSPFPQAYGLLTLRRSGLVSTQEFHMQGGSYTLKVPIEASYIPGVTVQVDLVGSAPRTNDQGEPDPKLPPRPAYAVGSVTLSVPPLERVLQVKIHPRAAALPPGGSTDLEVEVRDAQGQPLAGAEVAVVVVDEAVLALTGYQMADPIQVFYSGRGPGVSDYHMRAHVLLMDPEALRREAEGRRYRADGGSGVMAEVMPAPMAAPQASMEEKAASRDGGAAPIRIRTDFNALALFAPEVATDTQGRARVPLRVPDNLTRYRIMAVAVAGGRQFGQGESGLTARLPLMVRPSPPRFLNFGDRLELPVVVQNQTDQAMTVQVAVRASNLAFTAGQGRQVQVPANDRVEVRFPAAAQEAGTAYLQAAAASGSLADAAELSLPVWTPATSEAFATYGVLDQGAMAQPVQTPGEVWPQFGGLEVTTSSTALQALTDALLYLQAYPFECAEQISSRVMAVAALRDVLTAFQAQGLPSPREMLQAMSRDIARLRGLQNPDGGFAFWERGDESWPYISIHVAHALQRAKEKGFPVPDEVMARSLGYLRSIEEHINRDWYSPEARRVLTAYALYVRWRAKDPDPARARRLLYEAGGPEKLSMEAVGWVLPVLARDPASTKEVALLRRLIGNRVSETASTAQFTVSYGEDAYLLLYSSRRVDAILLEALIDTDPQNDLIPKLVNGLLAHRKKGRWDNTQENCFVLLALDRYFNTYEKVTPDFVARLWLGEDFAGQQSFKGRSTERQNLNIPMSWLAERPGRRDLILAKEGPGRLYYRIGMQYAPRSLQLEPADHGFTVERLYEAVDDKADVRRDPDGTWRIKAGARVRVRLTMVAPARRYHVALVDPLPAGLEALNPELAVTGNVPREAPGPRPRAREWFWWNPVWYEHENLRDERAEAFSSLLWEGVYEYVYVCRATTPGTFVVPPTRAEEMYAPETFGRGATDRVIVE